MSSSYGQEQFKRQQFKHTEADLAQKDVDYAGIKQRLRKPAMGLILSSVASVALMLGALTMGVTWSAFESEGIQRELVLRMFGPEVETKDSFGRGRSSKEVERMRERRDAQARMVQTLLLGGVIIGCLLMCAVYMVPLSGGIMMRQLNNYKMCRFACVVATIPLLSPLIVVGIPFGILGLRKLAQPDIKKGFLT